MIELFKCLMITSLILTHPLEQLSLDNYNLQDQPSVFFNESYYIAPGSGIINSIIENNGFFQVNLLLDDCNEVIYSGLTEVVKSTGDRVILGEPIGIDNTISTETKIIFMVYNASVLFPQFIENRLTFLLDRDTLLYMVSDGIVVYDDYDNSLFLRGLYIQIKLLELNAYIEYWHLSRILTRPYEYKKQGELIAYSGNTGASLEPKLVLHFEGDELGNDIRVIYLKPVMSDNVRINGQGLLP